MDLGFINSPEQFTPKDLSQLKSWTAYSVKNAAKIITISESAKKDIITTYRRDSEDIIVTSLAYDKQLFKPTTDTTLAGSVLVKYRIKRPYFLFLGSLKPNKNIEGLIEAFAITQKNHPTSNYRLVIAGKKAWLYESIFWKVRELNLESRVVFTDFVPETDIPALMSLSSAFVLPSFHEGFGIPVLEAMACGTPAVVAKVASLPEVAGIAGIYVDPRDPSSIAGGMMEAVGPQRSKRVKAGLIRAELFDWSKTAEATLRVLETAGKK